MRRSQNRRLLRLQVGVQADGLVEVVVETDRRGDFDRGGNLLVGHAGRKSGGTVRVKAVFTTVDRADRDDDELLGFRIEPLAGRLGDPHGQIEKVAVPPHRLKHFGDEPELLLDAFLNLDRLRIAGLVVKFHTRHFLFLLFSQSYSERNTALSALLASALL